MAIYVLEFGGQHADLIINRLNEIGFRAWTYKILGRGYEESNLRALTKKLKLEIMLIP